MSIRNLFTSASLALALIGGGIVLAPTSVEAAGKKHISYDALKKNNNSKLNRPGAQANKHTRGCSAITRCRG